MTAILFQISSIRKDLLKVSNNKDKVDGGLLEPYCRFSLVLAQTETTCHKKNLFNASHNASECRLDLYCLLEINFGSLEKKNLLKFGVA